MRACAKSLYKKIANSYFFIAPFFVECISEQDLDEMNIEIIRNTLYKVTLSNNNKIKLYLLSSLWYIM